MTNTLLGTEPAPDAQRDAIHQAIIPAIAGQILLPGQHVRVFDGKANPVSPAQGIVDPYRTDVIPEGSRFWLCLLPGTVTGMRHHWSHPDFEDVTPGELTPVVEKAAFSEKWLRDFAKTARLDYCDMMDMASEYLETGNASCFGDETATDAFYDTGGTAFWDHFEVVTGKKVKDKLSGPFRCAC